MSQYLYQTRLSDHIALTPEKYLIATGCVLCRSGDQQYLRSELDETSNSHEVITVNRPVAEVTSPQFLASLPGKSFVVNHPSAGLVTADNHSWSARGTVLRAYVDDEPDDDGNTLILGDIVIHDPTAIQRVLNGQRQLSVGYKYELEQGADGGLEMRNLIANHVALCDRGRAGNAMILDNAITDEDEIMTDENQNALCEKVDKLCALLEQFLTRKAEDDALVPVATLRKSERPENPIVDDLRRLRPAIEASRDRRAIDTYNAAMAAAKRGDPAPAEQFVALHTAHDGLSAGAPTFAEMCAKRGEEMRDGKLASVPTDYSVIPAERAALDSESKTESYTDMVARVGREMRCRTFQRG